MIYCKLTDHVIADVAAFQKAVKTAAANAEKGYLVTFGIVPTFPATGYGYVKAAGVETLGDLVQFNKTDLLKFRNFGKKSLTELDELLENMSLQFGTDISKYKLDKD